MRCDIESFNFLIIGIAISFVGRQNFTINIHCLLSLPSSFPKSGTRCKFQYAGKLSFRLRRLHGKLFIFIGLMVWLLRTILLVNAGLLT